MFLPQLICARFRGGMKFYYIVFLNYVAQVSCLGSTPTYGSPSAPSSNINLSTDKNQLNSEQCPGMICTWAWILTTLGVRSAVIPSVWFPTTLLGWLPWNEGRHNRWPTILQWYHISFPLSACWVAEKYPYIFLEWGLDTPPNEIVFSEGTPSSTALVVKLQYTSPLISTRLKNLILLPIQWIVRLKQFPSLARGPSYTSINYSAVYKNLQLQTTPIKTPMLN